ncbi:hypothetical protein E1B28_008995 [Marasmius oreades]|uniref:Uncharacterized protein n=1 Tax=Marasmius oreades TaxID=181124 RepID=A0A9P7USP3_9AGAR|nr:uncharacterized protein E1B28_008995 [Marasmius oreades]KAG7092658.1 hypothetical protein E1B28_008995 [Marasmius oreades]
MFEDSCIVCGRPLLDDSRAFCSDECRSQDASELSSSDCDVPPLSSRYSCYSVSSSDDDEDELSSLSSPSRSLSSVTIVTDDDLTLPSRLSYARRPSGTNNPSIQKALPVSQSVPSTTASIISDSEDDIPFTTAAATITTKSKRTRNRASLPAYFSLLQTQQHQHESYTQQQYHPQQQPIASTSSTSSPSTPKLSLAALTAALPTLPISPSRRRLGFGYDYSDNDSCSRSPSPPHPPIPDSRGRPSVRRNSSPPPKFNKFRGRLRADELAGMGTGVGVLAPGYGNGRSGLLDRESRR